MRIRKLRCSFCRKTEDKVSKLVAGPRLIVGPRVYICDACVAIANAIMQGNQTPIPSVTHSRLERLREWWRYLLTMKVLRVTSDVSAH